MRSHGQDGMTQDRVRPHFDQWLSVEVPQKPGLAPVSYVGASALPDTFTLALPDKGDGFGYHRLYLFASRWGVHSRIWGASTDVATGHSAGILATWRKCVWASWYTALEVCPGGPGSIVASGTLSELSAIEKVRIANRKTLWYRCCSWLGFSTPLEFLSPSF